MNQVKIFCFVKKIIKKNPKKSVEPESNWWPADFRIIILQSDALPTELPTEILDSIQINFRSQFFSILRKFSIIYFEYFRNLVLKKHEGMYRTNDRVVGSSITYYQLKNEEN